MRKTWRATLALVAAFVPATAHAQPAVTARGAIIVDADTGAAIWEMNADEPLPPASTTKVMTAVLALQSHRLAQEFPVSANAAATPPSKIGLRPGQSVALRDLLYAVLLKSANDAAVVVAEGVSGSEIQFADQMNLKARVIGATTTNFVNPHGLTDYGHLTTARDLSRIFRYGLGVPGFRDVLSTTSAEVFIDGPDARLATVRSHNRLLNAPDYQVIGKTGYTRPARRCFVGAAGHGQREVVIAILGSTDLWGDARRMLDYGLRPDRPTPVLMASATPPPVTAVARAVPAAELRAVPPTEPAERPEDRPAAFARAETTAAPQAAVDRAARMARAQGEESETDEAIAPSEPEAVAPAREPEPVAAPAAPRRTYEEPARPDLGREPAPKVVVPARHEAAVVEERAQPAVAEEPARPAPGAREDIVEPAAAEERQPGGEPSPSVWADSPLREPGEEPRPRRTVQPAREVEDSAPADEQAVPAVAPRPSRQTPSDRGVERERSKPTTVARGAAEPSRKMTRAEAARARRELAKASEDDRRKPTADDVRRRPSTESTRLAGRDTRADRRRASSTRDEQVDSRRGRVVLARASAMETRPTRVSAKGFEADRGRSAKAGRAGKRGVEAEDTSGKYTVQLGPYRDRKAVATARADLAKRGYEARVVGQKLQLGTFTERKRADRLATQLRVNGHPATSASAQGR